MQDDSKTKVISGDKARQGRKGTRILWLLLISLLLAVAVWFVAGTWGKSTAPSPDQQPPAGTTTQPPSNNQP